MNKPNLPAGTALPALFPNRSVNILVAGGGVGKTSLWMSQLERYLTEPGLPFLNHQQASHLKPVRCGFITYQRSIEHYRANMTRLGMHAMADEKQFPMYRWQGSVSVRAGLEEAYEELTKLAGGHAPNLIVFEGFQSIMSGGSSSKLNDVAVFFELVQEFLQDKACAVLAVAGMAKMRAADKLINVRDNPHGSVEWGGQIETMIILEDLDSKPGKDMESEFRKATLTRPMHPREVIYLAFDHNHRLLITDGQQFSGATKKTDAETLDDMLAGLPAAATMSKKAWSEWAADEGGVKFDSFEKWWYATKSEGYIKKVAGVSPMVFQKSDKAPVKTDPDELDLDGSELEDLIH